MIFEQAASGVALYGFDIPDHPDRNICWMHVRDKDLKIVNKYLGKITNVVYSGYPHDPNIEITFSSGDKIVDAESDTFKITPCHQAGGRRRRTGKRHTRRRHTRRRR